MVGALRVVQPPAAQLAALLGSHRRWRDDLNSSDILYPRALQKVGAFFADHHAGNAWIDTNHARED